MKNSKAKKLTFILIVILLSVLLIVFVTNKSPEKKIVSNWELIGSFENFKLNQGDFDGYEYFNLSLSDDGIVNVFSYPKATSENNLFSGLGTYSFIEEKNKQYNYEINFYTINESNEVKTYTTRLIYNDNKDQLMLFFSEDDGLLLERTDELTTVEITTTEIYLENYIGRYGYGEYYQYEDFYEGEVNIHSITDTSIVFDVSHYRLWGEDNVIATKNEHGYYYFEFIHTLVCGYILFENNNVIIDITKSPSEIIPLGKIIYSRIKNKAPIEKEEVEKITQNAEEIMQEFKLSCANDINSKDLVRYEDQYIGGNFSYTGHVQFCKEDNVFVILTDENYDGFYGDNWIYAKDYRNYDKTKILEGDTVTIYGTFTGVATDNYPCFKFYYADIKGVQ